MADKFSLDKLLAAVLLYDDFMIRRMKHATLEDETYHMECLKKMNHSMKTHRWIKKKHSEFWKMKHIMESHRMKHIMESHRMKHIMESFRWMNHTMESLRSMKPTMKEIYLLGIDFVVAARIMLPQSG